MKYILTAIYVLLLTSAAGAAGITNNISSEIIMAAAKTLKILLYFIYQSTLSFYR